MSNLSKKDLATLGAIRKSVDEMPAEAADGHDLREAKILAGRAVDRAMTAVQSLLKQAS